MRLFLLRDIEPARSETPWVRHSHERCSHGQHPPSIVILFRLDPKHPARQNLVMIFDYIR